MAKVLNKRIHGIPEGARYIGRPSRLGNPFVIGQDSTREQVIELYRRWIWQQMHDNPEMLRLVAELEGCDLVCPRFLPRRRTDQGQHLGGTTAAQTARSRLQPDDRMAPTPCAVGDVVSWKRNRQRGYLGGFKR